MNKLLSITALCLLFSTSTVVVAQNCFATPYGKSCGPKATGKITPQGATQHVELAVSKAAPDTFVLMVLGTTKLDIPITGTNCFAYTDLVFFSMHRTDNNGEFTFSKSIPRFSPGPPALLQFVELVFEPTFTVLTTNGVEIGCK